MCNKTLSQFKITDHVIQWYFVLKIPIEIPSCCFNFRIYFSVDIFLSVSVRVSFPWHDELSCQTFGNWYRCALYCPNKLLYSLEYVSLDINTNIRLHTHVHKKVLTCMWICNVNILTSYSVKSIKMLNLFLWCFVMYTCKKKLCINYTMIDLILLTLNEH